MEPTKKIEESKIHCIDPTNHNESWCRQLQESDYMTDFKSWRRVEKINAEFAVDSRTIPRCPECKKQIEKCKQVFETVYGVLFE